MTPELEVHHHTHRTGHRLLDLAVPVSALLISVISLVIGIHHGRTMQDMAQANARLVQANSWPFLQFSTSNINANGQQEIELKVENAGVGPAKLISLEIFHGEQRIRGTTRDLLPLLGPPGDRPPFWITGAPIPMVLRAGDSSLIVSIKREGQEALWDKFNTLRFELRFRACYCSVFDECWVSDLDTVSPQPVEHCAVSPYSFPSVRPRTQKSAAAAETTKP